MDAITLRKHDHKTVEKRRLVDQIIEALPSDGERFVAKVTVLIENVRHHAEEEEEDDLFPKVRDQLGTSAGITDRIGDTVSGLAQGGVTANGDIITTVLRRKRIAPQPTSSTIPRCAARWRGWRHCCPTSRTTTRWRATVTSTR